MNKINTTYEVKGVRLFDPRDNTWKVSNNPALVMLDLFVNRNFLLEVPKNFDKMICEMADRCDELAKLDDNP